MSERQYRINEQITARHVRIISADGSALGIRPIQEAIRIARQQGLDLVELVPNGSPPVCKLMDYGKYRYRQQKKEREGRRHQGGQMKDIQLRPRIAEHDLQIKVETAARFLAQKYKVRFQLQMFGRELLHPEVGLEILEKVRQMLAGRGTPEKEPEQTGSVIQVIFNSVRPSNNAGQTPPANPPATAGQ